MNAPGQDASRARVRTGVVLAAGLGSRLAPEGASASIKPLIEVNETPLLFRTFRGLERAGCSRVVVVLGHEAARLRTEIESRYDGPLELEFTLNSHYALKNGVSALCARPHVSGTFVLTMSDHVVEDAIMDRVRDHEPPAGGATLCVDYKIDQVFDLDDATKVVERGGRLVDIGKALPNFNCIDTGVFVCTTGLLDAIEEVYRETGDASLSNGVARLAAQGRMTVLDVEDGFWQDVDTPEMLAHAESSLSQRTGA